MMTDPIADLLTRIRNANRIRKKKTTMPASRLRVAIAQVLKDEGFIRDYEVLAGTPASSLSIELRYGPDGEQVIRTIERVSKPGCRVFSGLEALVPILRGQGIQIVSTNKGVMSDRRAREEKIGGEVLARVW